MATENGLSFPKSGLMVIGMGPGKISSMTIEAKQAAIAADYRRYEAYTALWPEEEYVKLENEIEEELRRKQLKALWDKFGLYLIGAVLVIILSFGGYEFSKYLGYKNSETSSDQYESALEALVNENNNHRSGLCRISNRCMLF